MEPLGEGVPPRPDLTGATPPTGGIWSPYATFWQRVGGRLIDGLLLGVPVLVLTLALFWDDIRRLRSELGHVPGSWELMRNLGGPYIALILVVLTVGAVYEIAFITVRGQTIGHRAAGVKVVRQQDGGLPTVAQAAIRWAVPIAATYLLPGIGGLLAAVIYLWMLWDPRRQGLHDKAAGTVVLRV